VPLWIVKHVRNVTTVFWLAGDTCTATAMFVRENGTHSRCFPVITFTAEPVAAKRCTGKPNLTYKRGRIANSKPTRQKPKQAEKTGGEKRPLGSVIHLCDFPGHLLIE